MNPTEGISIIDARFRMVLTVAAPILFAASDGVQALLGYSAEDFLSGKIALDKLIHPGDQDITETLFSPAPPNGEGSFNIRIRQANGRIRCIKGHYSKEATVDGVALDLLLQDAKSLPRTMADAATMPNFVAMMENTDDFIFFKDRNHVLTGASQTLASICPPAEHWTDLLGQTDYDIFPEEYADIYYRIEKQVFAGTPVAQEIQEYLTRDGAKGWVDNRKYPIRDKSGEIIGLFGIARDITERKQAEIVLRENTEALALANTEITRSEQKFRAIAEIGPFAVVISDSEQSTLYQNPMFEKMFGYTIEENSSVEAWWPLAYPDEKYRNETRQRWNSAVEKAIRSRSEIAPQEALVTCKDGSQRHIEFRMRSSGELNIVIGIDITGRKRAEEALRESEARLTAAQRIAHIGNWELDLVNNRLWWSEEIYRIFEIDPNQFAASYEAFLAAIHPDDREAVNRAYQDSLEYRAPYAIEHRLLLSGGRIKHVHERCETMFDQNGKALRSIGTVQDITERKQAEQLRRSEQELKAQQAEAQKFSAHLQSVREEEKAAIAREIHDNLGSTLTALKMKTFQLKTGLPTNKETMQLHELIRSMSQLINDASGIARHIITGLQPTMLIDLGLLAAIEWQAEQVQTLSGIKCMVNCIGDKGGLDQQRSIALFRIIQEALTNVVRHSSASRVEIEFHHSDEEVVMSVIDNGVGITKGHDNGSSHYGIHGMRERTALLGGTINFETPPGGGFGVTVILPLFVRNEDES